MSTLGGVIRVGVFAGPFMATLAMRWWGIAGAYWIGVASMTVALVVCFAIPELPQQPRNQRAPVPVRPAPPCGRLPRNTGTYSLAWDWASSALPQFVRPASGVAALGCQSSGS